MHSFFNASQSLFPSSARACAAVALVASAGALSGCSVANASEESTGSTRSSLSLEEPWSGVACPSEVPASLVPPSGNRVKFALHVARGTQDYACTNGAFVLQNPEAVLSNGEVTSYARHFFGAAGSPLFASEIDGSEVDLAKIASAPAPAADSVAWVLLQTVATAEAKDGSPGIFSNVTFVQRLDTLGGNPPSGACDASQIVKVPYTAHYFFYEAGEGKVCE